ncbi:hypothetical protein WA026_018065 [Henosepilachna vigintioctopunctata]|uniref:Uncharacterized protein n=1 Tax=Henosepilachna vigintioctopunctata TaxID=420089 RepID=A0AAW1UL90_9CUCU
MAAVKQRANHFLPFLLNAARTDRRSSPNDKRATPSNCLNPINNTSLRARYTEPRYLIALLGTSESHISADDNKRTARNSLLSFRSQFSRILSAVGLSTVVEMVKCSLWCKI